MNSTGRRATVVATTLAACLSHRAHAQAIPVERGGATTALTFTPIAASALSNRTVFFVTQDSVGYLWAGTNDGLARFDGYAVVFFRHDPADSTSIANNTVRRILEDPEGRMWVRTESTLDRFDRTTGRFRHYPLIARELLIDAGGRLLVAGPAGVHRYDAARDTFQLVTDLQRDGRTLTDDPVWGFFQTVDGRLWVSTERGWLFSTDTNAEQVVAHRSPWRQLVLGHEDGLGRLWIGHANGVGVFVPNDNQFRPLESASGIPLPTSPVIAVRPVTRDLVWAGGSTLSQLAVTAHGRVVAQPIELPDPVMTSPYWWIHRDQRGVTWLGTNRGLLFHDPWAKPIDFIGIPPAPGNPATSVPVMALEEDDRGAIWVGTLGSGIAVVTPDGRVTRGPRRTSTGPCHSDVWALRWSRRRLWLGTGGGLCVLDRSGVAAQPILLRASAGPEPIVFAIAEDSSGSLWVGTSSGLVVVEPVRGRVRHVRLLSRDRGGVVRAEGLLVDVDGGIWVGTSNSDIYRIDPATLDARLIRTGDQPSLLGSEGFWTLAAAPDDRLLVGGDRGLFRVDPATGRLSALGAGAGVPATGVYALAHDSAGDLWMSGDNGLARLTSLGLGYVTRTFSTVDGVPIGEFNRRAFLRTANGDFLFGGMGGIIRFQPDRMRDNPVAPPLVITDLEVIAPNGTRTVAGYGVSRLALARGDRGFAAEFAALAHVDASQMRYEYRLSEMDEAWVPARSDRRARYPSLPPGGYTFEVRALAAGGATESRVSLAVIVPTPWWATSVFRITLVLGCAGILVVVVRSVSTRRLARQVRALELERQLQSERERISRDLHDHVGGQMATLLSGIELAQLSASGRQYDRASEYLESVAIDARTTLGQLRETVWSLRTEGLSVLGLSHQIDDHLRGRQKYITQPTLRLQADARADYRLTSAQAMHLFRIAQEAVNNAIAHAGASCVDVSLRESEGGRVELSIHDNGSHPVNGRPGSSSGLGISGMESRAAEIGAVLQWERNTAGGTTVYVTLLTA